MLCNYCYYNDKKCVAGEVWCGAMPEVGINCDAIDKICMNLPQTGFV